MFAGASWTWWLGFHLAVVVLLAVDSFLPGRRSATRHGELIPWLWTGVLVLITAGFAVWIAATHGHQIALEFVAGYTIEASLSIDNLFVFMVIFQGFHISELNQHKALLWGVGGAVILRALFIAAGITLLRRFEWITWIFGIFLMYAAWRLVKGDSTRDVIPGWIRHLHVGTGSLLPVILAIEFTDLLFAVDSIPAVLAVSYHPFVVYTSNIAAVLGLRALYFALASLLDRLRFLHYGLGALLAFVAFKMLTAHWIEISIALSLAIIGAILAVSVMVSLWAARADQR